MLNYRQKNINFQDFSGQDLANACFWGVSAKSALFKSVVMTGADCRIGDFSYANFQEAECRGCNFTGAFFNQACFINTDLTNTIFSSPSIFTCIFSPETCLEGAIYSHLGEENYWLEELIRKKDQENLFFPEKENPYFKRA